jgi:hypothetical protein
MHLNTKYYIYMFCAISRFCVLYPIHRLGYNPASYDPMLPERDEQS